MVQEKTYQGERACGNRHNDDDDDNDNERGTIRISFLLGTPVLCLTTVMLAETWLSKLCLPIEHAVMFYNVQVLHQRD